MVKQKRIAHCQYKKVHPLLSFLTKYSHGCFDKNLRSFAASSREKYVYEETTM